MVILEHTEIHEIGNRVIFQQVLTIKNSCTMPAELGSVLSLSRPGILYSKNRVSYEITEIYQFWYAPIYSS